MRKKIKPIKIVCLLIGILIMSVGMADRIRYRFSEPTNLESLGSNFLTNWGWLILLAVGSIVIITAWGWSNTFKRLQRLHLLGKVGLGISVLGIINIFANLIPPQTSLFLWLFFVGIAGFIVFAISYRISGREKVSI